MDNWNNSTSWQQQFQRGGQGSANEYASGSGGDPPVTRQDRHARDFRSSGEAYSGGRGTRGRHRGGPPPRGAFPGRRGRGRQAPAPFSVDAEEFVPRSQQSGQVNGTNWEDAPEFIPAAQQQQGAGSTQDKSAGRADVSAENGSCVNGIVSESSTTDNNSSSNNSNNNNNNSSSKGNGDSEKGGTGGDGDGGLASRRAPFGQGAKRRPDTQWRGSARGRGRGGGGRGGWQPQQRRQPVGADDARNRNWREPAPEYDQPPSPARRPTSDSPVINGEGADNTHGSPAYGGGSRGGRVRERQWRGGGGDRPRQVGSGRFTDSGGRRVQDGGRYSDWQAGEGNRDRGRTASDSGGSGPVEREAENGETEVRRDAPDGRQKTAPAQHGRSDSKMWRGVTGGSSRGHTEQPAAASGEEAEAAVAVDAAAAQGPVPADRQPEEDSRSRRGQPADSGGNRSVGSPRSRAHQPYRGEDGASDSGHRERLSVQLMRSTLECLVCCERLRPRDPVWSCAACHHVLHLGCTRRWARSSRTADSGGWPCPACRHEVPRVPTEYRCWCGKRRDPEWTPYEVPHSCGEMCGKPRGGTPVTGQEEQHGRVDSGGDGCTHRCTLLCHPGPCPPCTVQVNRSCGCGRESRLVVCGQQVLCGATCGRALSCGRHRCERTCHPGPCGRCELVETKVCWCGKTTREVPCDSDEARADSFACGEVCGRALACGNHRCEAACHEGRCAPCALSPDVVTHCPCGKVALRDMQGTAGEAGGVTASTAESGGASDATESSPEETGRPAPDTGATGVSQEEDCEEKASGEVGYVRTSCLDPVPTCGQVCGKLLPCGQPSQPHECAAPCHTGPCPPCPLVTSVKCRCGSLDKELPCCELTTRADDARCSRRCTKKRACGKHKCGQECCIEQDHTCPLVCNHVLSCGKHRCEELCHRGNCKPCLQSSFDELTCECGAQVIEPPVPCGTRRPTCDRPCPREHPCGHAPLHSCHSEPTCPPCTVLVQRWCYGGHELRKAVPCHQTELSCGRPCGKDLPCGRHTCATACHAGPCPQTCTQPCTKQRQLCGHPCAAPCHDGPCPDTPCREMVVVTCECGHRSTTRPCAENVNEYRRIAMSLLAAKMTDVRAGRTVDLTDLAGTPRGITLKTLDCNDECKIVERSRRLAIALQIRNPDLSAKLTPRYSDYMRQWAKKDPAFCAMVHDKLTELVKLAKESKQKSRSYSFDPMNREKRHFVHEYCEHFGCESVAYDQEPKRNIVATASRDKAWLPSMSLLEVIQRESGQRKIPKPVISSTGRAQPAARPMEVLSASSPSQQQQPLSERESSSWVTMVGPSTGTVPTASSSTAATATQPRQQSEYGGES
ncbi:protein shuttle craft [Schistocerca piceifrons]|uniref:protein shuttle craft n=1 Tax=Schistocerca piceifrons TaxID=274613 RepID=UPI001F5FCF86|nr:protein shuttle craft [Schistocerca piceifrons]